MAYLVYYIESGVDKFLPVGMTMFDSSNGFILLSPAFKFELTQQKPWIQSYLVSIVHFHIFRSFHCTRIHLWAEGYIMISDKYPSIRLVGTQQTFSRKRNRSTLHQMPLTFGKPTDITIYR